TPDGVEIMPSSLSAPASTSPTPALCTMRLLERGIEYARSSKTSFLFLFTDPFERLAVRFLVHEAPGSRVPFRPALGYGIENLGPFPTSSIAGAISTRRIRSHKSPRGIKKYAVSPFCLTGS